jgi:phosphoglycerate kinase
MSHLGRPDGIVNKEMSLKPVSLSLEKMVGEAVLFLDDCVGPGVEEACCTTSCRFVMLENLRFHVEEEGRCKRGDGSTIAATSEQTKVFQKSLSALGDVYINDAFGTMHRAHSSITGIGIAVRAAGFLVQKELNFFAKILNNPAKLDLLILGGAKVSDKILLIENMLPKTKRIMLGGGMAFTFLAKLKNYRIGKSLYDSKGADLIPSIMEKAKRFGVEILLPVDATISTEFSEKGAHKVVDMQEGIDDGWLGLDIGPKTQKIFCSAIDSIRGSDRTILWNGPMGVFEWSAFAAGTKTILDALVHCNRRRRFCRCGS